MPRRVVAAQRFSAPARRAVRPRSSTLRNPLTQTVFSATVTNSGTVASAPVISIAGPLSTPTVYFENATADKRVTLNITVGAGQTLSVDFATRIVTLASVEQSGVVTVESRWWDLAPGANTVRSNVAASVSHRNAFS